MPLSTKGKGEEIFICFRDLKTFPETPRASPRVLRGGGEGRLGAESAATSAVQLDSCTPHWKILDLFLPRSTES